MTCNNNCLMTIQPDWDDVLWKLEGEVWVAYKERGQKSIEGKLRCSQISSNGLPTLVVSSGFGVDKISKDSLQLHFTKSQITTAFIAASKIYSGIHKKGVTSLSISPKGLSVSVCKDNQLLVWDFNQGELKCTLNGHVGDVYKCKFFPSGEVVLSGGADMQLKVWCALSGRCAVTLTGHTMAVTDFDFVHRGKNIVSVSKDGSAKLWSCGTSRCIADVVSLSSTINVCHVITAPPYLSLGEPKSPPDEDEVDTNDKLLLLGCEDGTVHGVAICSRKTLFSISCGSEVSTLVSLTNEYFIVGCQSGQVIMYSVRDTSQPVKTWFESNSAILSVVSYKEEGFFTSQADGQVVYREVKVDNKRVNLTGPNCDPVYQLCADDKFVYSCSRDSLIRRYNVERVISSFFQK